MKKSILVLISAVVALCGSTTAVKNALMRRFGINASRLSTANEAHADHVTFGEK